MKIIIALALGILSSVALAATDSCKFNGYSRATILQREASITEALRDNDASQFADDAHLPLIINLKNGTHIITTTKQLTASFDKIFVATDRTTLANQLEQQATQVICRSEGVGLLNGNLWLDPNDLKLMTVNSGAIPHTLITSDQPYGYAVQPITSQKVLEQFAKLYNKLHHTKTIDGPALFVVRISDHMYQLNSEDNSGVIRLYYADVNNTGQKDYILVYEQQGSLNTDVVRFIGRAKGNSLQPLNLKQLIRRTYHINNDRWYLFHSSPFITTKGLTYLSYKNNGVTCTYLWKGHTISLVSKDSKDCISRKP